MRNFTTGSPHQVEGSDADPHCPWWYQTPPPSTFANINLDVLSHPTVHQLCHSLLEHKGPVVSRFIDVRPFVDNERYHMDFHEQYQASDTEMGSQQPSSDGAQGAHLADHHHRQRAREEAFHGNAMARPHSVILYPVFRDLYNTGSPVVGFLLAVLAWDAYIEGLLPPDHGTVQIALENSCDEVVSYVIDGSEVSQIPHKRISG
jgi:hypothetical protein